MPNGQIQNSKWHCSVSQSYCNRDASMLSTSTVALHLYIGCFISTASCLLAHSKLSLLSLLSSYQHLRNKGDTRKGSRVTHCKRVLLKNSVHWSEICVFQRVYLTVIPIPSRFDFKQTHMKFLQNRYNRYIVIKLSFTLQHRLTALRKIVKFIYLQTFSSMEKQRCVQ